jgi:tetratricopeptide (TPR) repeat protein
MKANINRGLLLALLVSSPCVLADRVATLPEDRAGELQPVAQPNLEGQPEDISTVLVEARAQVDALLQSGAAATELADAYGDLGSLYQIHQLGQAAERCFENAVQLAPDSFRWAYYLAWVTLQSGRNDLALQRFETARKLDPDYAVLTLRMADAWLDLNQQDKAQAAYQAVVDVEGLQAASRYGLGQIALLRRDYAQAVDYLTQVLALDPAATRVHYPLAQALRALEQNDAAREHLAQLGNDLPVARDPLVEELQALQSGARLYFSRAMKAIRKHDYAAAVTAFEQGLQRDPENPDARVSYARSLYLAGDTDAARAALEAMLVAQPEHVTGRFLLAVLQDESGATAAAVSDYTRVLELDPAHAGANFYLANYYFRQGKYDAAALHYARAVAADARNVPARLLQLAALQKIPVKDVILRQQLETAVQQVPEQPLFVVRLISLLCTSDAPDARDPAEALRLAERLVGEQAFPPYRELLALAYAATGDFGQAADTQEALLSLAIWTMPGEAARLEKGLSAYREKQMPEEDALPMLPSVQVPPLDVAAVFRDYPTARPY